MTYRYEVRLACQGELDARGFILDNRILNRYFIEKFRIPFKELPSCERIAMEALTDLRQLCGMCEIVVSGVEVRIYGGTHSAVTVRWPRTFAASQATATPGYPLPEPIAEDVEEDSRTLQHMRQLVQ